MDNWEILKTVLEADKESWKQELGNLEVKWKLSIDPKEQAEIQAQAALLAVYEGVLTHYLQLMTDIENGKIVIEEAEEVGGSILN